MPSCPGVSLQELLDQSAQVHDDMERMPTTPEATAFLLGECFEDSERGYGGPVLTREQMDEIYGAGNWLAMLRFEIIQASGKHRPIDNGRFVNQGTQYKNEKCMLFRIDLAL